MKAIIDTSSLFVLVRYYLPFDRDNSLKTFIEQKISSGEIILIDKVYDESKYISKGIILNNLDSALLKSAQTKTTDLTPNKSFFNMLENQFQNKVQRNKLTDVQFEAEKKTYLEQADAKLILHCLSKGSELELDKPILVTEETISNNDNKLFIKLPGICKILNIDCCDLPTLLKKHYNLNLSGYLE